MTKNILQQCLISAEPPLVLTARKRLYGWLLEKLKAKPGWKALQGVSPCKVNSTRNVDCLVQAPSGSFAYLIIDKSLKPEDLTTIKNMANESQWALNAYS